MLSFALGIGTQNTQGDWLEIYYPAPLLNPDASLVAAAKEALDAPAGNAPVIETGVLVMSVGFRLRQVRDLQVRTSYMGRSAGQRNPGIADAAREPGTFTGNPRPFPGPAKAD